MPFGLALVLFVLLLALPTAASALVSTGDGGWVWQNPLPQGSTLAGVTFSDATHGWAVGYGGTIIATTDGGAAWNGQSSGLGANAALSDVAFPDATHGWAVGSSYDSTTHTFTSLIFATTDGGATWKKRTSVSHRRLVAVSFVDATHGWAVGGGPGATILATTNGGATWKDQTPGSDADLSGVTLFAVAFPDVTHGWAVGYSGTILATTNGGATWRKQSSGVAGNLFGVAFADATHGWAVGGRTIFATTSGGFPPPAPIITSVSPPVGVTETVLTVTGSGFTGSGAVAFNGVGATDSSLVSDMLITATVPASATTGSITVTTPGGSGANASNFTVTAAPPSPTITLKLSGLTAGAS